MATHNQRGRGFLCIETDDDQYVDLEKIIHILKDSMSAGIYEPSSAATKVQWCLPRTRIRGLWKTVSGRWQKKS